MDQTINAVNIFDKCATEYQEKFMDVNLYQGSLNQFCDSIKKDNAFILEIACGPGNITRYLLNKRPGFYIHGIDLSANMIALATKNNPEATFQLMDARFIDQLNKQYDAIVCGFCLPYLSKAEALKLISDVATLLHREGVFYLSAIEDNYAKSGWRKSGSGDEMYMYYHEFDYLAERLANEGLEIKYANRIYPTRSETTTTELLIVAMKS